MSQSVPLSVPYLQGNEHAYVSQCIETSWVSTAGPFVEKFEKASFMEYG